jgi:hypothetical protein
MAFQAYRPTPRGCFKRKSMLSVLADVGLLIALIDRIDRIIRTAGKPGGFGEPVGAVWPAFIERVIECTGFVP